MHATPKTEMAPAEVLLKKQDLINAWLVLEKLVVSADKIGSFYSTRSQEERTGERTQQLHTALGKFVADNLLNDANKYRIPMGECLSDEEAESLSDQIEYWEPTSTDVANRIL